MSLRHGAVHRRPTAALAVLALLLGSSAGPLLAQLAPLPYDQGALGLGLALRRLPVTGRVLCVTAHPDDEHNGVLVRLSRGLGLRTGLLTLTRGEGGQNEIGAELFESLGVLRTEELAAVHRYDGAEQFFGRAYEFGFSYSIDETFEKWGRDETLGDVVRVIRAFRPDVILTLPLEGPGHQHHTAAAVLARDAFRAAADPTRFPDQLRKGLFPWQARKIYQGGVGGVSGKGAPPSVVVRTGVYDPLLGMSSQELGSLARSFHKCQGTSQLKANPVEGEAGYSLVDSEPPVAVREADVLDGIDVSLGGLQRFVNGHEAKAPFLADDLGALLAPIDEAQAAFDPRAPERSVPPLAAGLDAVRRLRVRVMQSGLPDTVRHELINRLSQKEQDFLETLALAQGLAFEVLADDDLVVPGQTFTVTATVWNQSPLSARVDDVVLAVPEGWRVKRTSGEPRTLQPRQLLQMKFQLRVADRARYSQPYWKRNPMTDRYDLDNPAHETLPWSPPEVVATLKYTSSGVAAEMPQPAIWRYAGRWVGGEKQKLVSVVPALSVSLEPEIVVVPLSAARPRRELRVSVQSNLKGVASAGLRLEAPAGWTVEPPQTALGFRQEGEEVAARFVLVPPPGLREGDFSVRAVATLEGQEFAEGEQVVAYDHIQERRSLRPATCRVKALDVRVAPGASVGYVMGPGDEVAAAIRQLGIPVTFLSESALAQGDLSKYSTIVTGIRAYKTRSDLRSNHRRLMAYVQEGGNLLVQYNKLDFNQLAEPRPGETAGAASPQPDSPHAPYSAAVSGNRVTDENAEVKVLVPESPVLNVPNRIGPRDFEGWVQERGLHFLEARDKRYLELLAAADPFPGNPGDKKGLLVEARVGRGTWTYVGLGLWRQLPAGTNGAYRILANLVSRPRGR